MANTDFVVRLKKSIRDGGENLGWVVYPRTNKRDQPAVIEDFNAARAYPAGSFATKDGKLIKSKLNIPVRFVPTYKTDADIIAPIVEDLTPPLTAVTGVIATLYNMPHSAKIAYELSVDVSTKDPLLNSTVLQIRNANNPLVLGTVNFQGLTDTPTTQVYNGVFTAEELETIVLASEQLPIGEEWQEVPNEAPFVNGPVSRFLAKQGHLFLVSNVNQTIMHRNPEGVWTQEYFGDGLPTWSNVSAIGFSAERNKFVIARANGEIFAKDMNAGSWTNETANLAGLTGIRSIEMDPDNIWVQDWTNASIFQYDGFDWIRIDALGGLPVATPQGLFYRDGMIHTMDTTANQLRAWQGTTQQWVTVTNGAFTSFDASTLSFNYDQASKTLVWVDTTTGTIYASEDSQDPATAREIIPLAGSLFAGIVDGIAYAADGVSVKRVTDVYAFDFTNLRIKLDEIVPPVVDDGKTPPEDAFIADEWEDVNEYEAFVMPHSTNINYSADSIVYDEQGDIWYLKDAAPKGTFESQGWERVSPEDMIQTAVAYLDPKSKIEAPKVITGGFTELTPEITFIKTIARSFYNTADKFTLRQDVDGTVPVTKPGDKVRLIYDQISTRHIRIDTATPGYYREDENGRGYVELPYDEANRCYHPNDATEVNAYIVIPNVGVIKSANTSFTDGLPLRPSDRATIPFAQYAIVDSNKSAEQHEQALDDLHAYVRRYSNEVVTDLNSLFRSQTNGFHFPRAPMLRFVKSISRMFQNNDMSIHDLSMFDVSSVEDFERVFYGAEGTFNVDTWQTSNARNFKYMFGNALLFNAPVNHLDFSNVIDASGMFYQAEKFNQPLDGIDLNNAESLDNFLDSAVSFNQDISSLSNVATSSAIAMMEGCQAFNQTVVLDMPNLVVAEGMFANCTMLNADVTINAPLIVNSSYMFLSCAMLNGRVQLNSNKIEKAFGMFKQCERLNATMTVDFSVLREADAMFMGCAALNQQLNINPATLETINFMFQDCQSLVPQPFTTLKFENLKSAESAFQNCASLDLNLDLHAPFLTNMDNMFYNCISVDSPVRIEANNATRTANLLRGCSAISKTVELILGRTLDLSYALSDAALLNAPVIIKAPRVINLEGLLMGCAEFNSSLSVTTDYVTNMDNMFRDALKFNQPITFDLSSVNTAAEMFNNAEAFNQPIDMFPLNEITNLTGFLRDAKVYAQDLSDLCVDGIAIEPVGFLTGSGIAGDSALHPLWGQSCEPEVVPEG